MPCMSIDAIHICRHTSGQEDDHINGESSPVQSSMQFLYRVDSCCKPRPKLKRA